LSSRLNILGSCTLAFTASAFAVCLPVAAAPVIVVLDTELGEIQLSLDADRAPLTTANFLRYLDAGLFVSASFYRTVHEGNQPDDAVRIAVIQGGLGDAREAEALPPIRMEGTAETGLRHLDGTISMARLGPDTARGEFFICVGDQPELDEGGHRNSDGFGFAAFGRVMSGMSVVRAIHRSPVEQQLLTPSIEIHGARRQAHAE
jgi:peptidyl-prolyl cis-trans isomerase A (cyclophilin A)